MVAGIPELRGTPSGRINSGQTILKIVEKERGRGKRLSKAFPKDWQVGFAAAYPGKSPRKSIGCLTYHDSRLFVSDPLPRALSIDTPTLKLLKSWQPYRVRPPN